MILDILAVIIVLSLTSVFIYTFNEQILDCIILFSLAFIFAWSIWHVCGMCDKYFENKPIVTLEKT